LFYYQLQQQSHEIVFALRFGIYNWWDATHFPNLFRIFGHFQRTAKWYAYPVFLANCLHLLAITRLFLFLFCYFYSFGFYSKFYWNGLLIKIRVTLIATWRIRNACKTKWYQTNWFHVKTRDISYFWIVTAKTLIKWLI